MALPARAASPAHERRCGARARAPQVLPPELRFRDSRVTSSDAELSAEEAFGAREGVTAATHRSQARAVATALRQRAVGGPQAWGPAAIKYAGERGGGVAVHPAVNPSPRIWRGGAAAIPRSASAGAIGGTTPRLTAGTPRGVASSPRPAVGVLLHQQGPPPERSLAAAARPPTPGYPGVGHSGHASPSRGRRGGGGEALEAMAWAERGVASPAYDPHAPIYPAVARRELFNFEGGGSPSSARGSVMMAARDR